MSQTAQHRIRRSTLALLAALGLTLAGGGALVSQQRVPTAPSPGPDVTVIYLSGFSNYGEVGGIRAYSLGTTSCNIGDTPVNWCDEFGGCGVLQSNQHPVIAQNIYRLKDGRFDQIGMSWLKHGFLSTNSIDDACLPGTSCISPPLGGSQLGVGCTDTYGSSLNGSWSWMGPRSEVNAATGAYPFPAGNGPTSQVIDQRIQIDVDDLDPTLNVGALYFGEGHYIADNDALYGNGFNNASWRPVSVGAGPSYDLAFTASTVREQAAIQAWKVQDLAVEIIDVDVLSSGNVTERFHVARKVSEPAPGTWHYEYAIQNLNSDRSAQRLAIDFPDGTTVGGAGYKGIDHHSNEPYPTHASAPWTIGVDGAASTVSWASELFAGNNDANALRWATLYNFWFDAALGPDQITRHTLTLFKPGMPCRVDFSFTPAPDYVFADDFETGDFCTWSGSVL